MKVLVKFACVAACALASYGLTVGVASASPTSVSGSSYIPRVDLSPDSPNVIHNPDGSVDVKFKANPNDKRDTGLCHGQFYTPSIVSLGTKGTATHYGVKYFCTEPVEYQLNVNIEDWYDGPDGSLLGHYGGSVGGQGVSMQPTEQGNSFPCVNNLNSGWQPFLQGELHGIDQSENGAVTTVGCRVD